MSSGFAGDTFRTPGLCPPQLEDLRALNQEMKYMCPDQQLKEMSEVLDALTTSYQRVSEMTDTTIPPVKYPRTPGHRPLPEDNPYNAWAWRCDIQGAGTGKLAGKTVAIKDSIAVAGVPMSNGSKLLQGYVPEFDATIVSRILDAGGRIVGKTSVEDMCISLSSLTNSYGPVRNPLDETRVAGGSSGGSAALVASGLVDLATGADQGGSIRVPASFTGIVGFKPTWGLIPYTGAANIEPTVDNLGPMAKTVTDCALLLEVMAGYDDGRDARQFPTITVPQYTQLLNKGVAGKKVGLLMEGFELCTEEVVQRVVRQAAKRLTEAGCIVKEISVPMHKDAAHIRTVAEGHGSMKCILECNGTAYFTKGVYATSLQDATFRGLAAQPHDVSPIIKFISLYTKHVERLYGNMFYAKGQNLKYELGKRYDAALKEVDVLVLPTVTRLPPKIPPAGCSFVDLFNNCRTLGANTVPFNSTGHPALSINAGFSPPENESESGLPIGMTIVGRQFDEVTVLQVARAFEKLISGH